MPAKTPPQSTSEFLLKHPQGLSLSVYSIDFKPQENCLVLEIDCTDPNQPDTALNLTCAGVEQYSFSGNTSSPAGLEVSKVHPLLWRYGPQATVFGTAPLPDPQRFFFDFYRLIREELQLPGDPALYLNGGQQFSRWLEFVGSRAYRLLTGPVPVTEGARELLDVQAAEYTVLPDETHSGPRAEELQVVQIGALQVVCRSSSAFWSS